MKKTHSIGFDFCLCIPFIGSSIKKGCNNFHKPSSLLFNKYLYILQKKMLILTHFTRIRFEGD